MENLEEWEKERLRYTVFLFNWSFANLKKEEWCIGVCWGRIEHFWASCLLLIGVVDFSMFVFIIDECFDIERLI